MKALGVPWGAGDAADVLAGAVIVGRALIKVPAGGEIHALLIDVGSFTPVYRAVYWERPHGHFVVCEVDHG